MASLMKHDTQLQACRALQCPSFIDVINTRTLLLKMGHCDGKLGLRPNELQEIGCLLRSVSSRLYHFHVTNTSTTLI